MSRAQTVAATLPFLRCLRTLHKSSRRQLYFAASATSATAEVVQRSQQEQQLGAEAQQQEPQEPQQQIGSTRSQLRQQRRELQQQQRQRRQQDLWPGLQAWRAAGLDLCTVWGEKGPCKPEEDVAGLDPEAAALPASLAEAGRAVLLTADPRQKAALTHRAWWAYNEGLLPLGTAEALAGPPARPAKPDLVPARQIPSMDASPLPKAVYMLHNLAHVELNAIDLAWDTLVRFSPFGLPPAFYEDFCRVADDESRHLGWCLQRLEELGYSYGCMPAHNLLWEGAELSAYDLGARLAVVPMSQEARGLDAGERLANRLVGLGDNRTAAIVRRIAFEEHAHVAVGVTWFEAICGALGTAPGPTFQQLILELCPALLSGPFNEPARLQAGLPAEWYKQPQLQEAARQAALAERGEQQQQQQARGSPVLALAPVADEERLRQLAARLSVMLGVELAAR